MASISTTYSTIQFSNSLFSLTVNGVGTLFTHQGMGVFLGLNPGTTNGILSSIIINSDTSAIVNISGATNPGKLFITYNVPPLININAPVILTVSASNSILPNSGRIQYQTMASIDTIIGKNDYTPSLNDGQKIQGVNFQKGNIDHNFIGILQNNIQNFPSGYDFSGIPLYGSDISPNNTKRILDKDNSFSQTQGSYTFNNGILPQFKNIHQTT